MKNKKIKTQKGCEMFLQKKKKKRKKKEELIPTHPTLVLVTNVLFFQPHP
jgi:hypothetical protein